MWRLTKESVYAANVEYTWAIWSAVGDPPEPEEDDEENLVAGVDNGLMESEAGRVLTWLRFHETLGRPRRWSIMSILSGRGGRKGASHK